jgi:hypothetical protein
MAESSLTSAAACQPVAPDRASSNCGGWGGGRSSLAPPGALLAPGGSAASGPPFADDQGALYDAVKLGRGADAVRRLLQAGRVDVREFDRADDFRAASQTPLGLAIAQRDWATCDLLVDAGASVARASVGVARAGDWQGLAYLGARDAAALRVDDMFVWAATSGHLAFAQAMLDRGADVHHTPPLHGDDPDYALLHAVCDNQHAAVEFLLARGARVSQLMCNVAAARGHLLVLAALERHLPQAAATSSGEGSGAGGGGQEAGASAGAAAVAAQAPAPAQGAPEASPARRLQRRSSSASSPSPPPINDGDEEKADEDVDEDADEDGEATRGDAARAPAGAGA